MAKAKKTSTTIKVGGRRSTSSSRPTSVRRKQRVMPRWKYIATAAAITATVLALAYYPFIRPAFNRFTPCNGHKIFGACIPKGYSVYGIDISHHQGVIDWEELKQGDPDNPEISFVYMKATEGSDYTDSRFKKNWHRSKEEGFTRGAYHYFSTTSKGEAQADMFMSLVDLKTGDLPPMVDVEEEPKNAKTFREELKKCLNRLEKHYGVKPIIYTNKYFKEKYLDKSLLEKYPIWIAQYHTLQPGISEEWVFWQCSERGKIPGIKRRVDINIVKGGHETIERLKIK